MGIELILSTILLATRYRIRFSAALQNALSLLVNSYHTFVVVSRSKSPTS